MQSRNRTPGGSLACIGFLDPSPPTYGDDGAALATVADTGSNDPPTLRGPMTETAVQPVLTDYAMAVTRVGHQSTLTRRKNVMDRRDATPVQVTAAEMESRTARFNELVSYKVHLQRDGNIPAEVIEQIAAQTVYPVMIPKGYEGRHANAPIKDGNLGLVVALVESPPGDGASLHIHEQTVENFFCVSGRFLIMWGDHGENSLVLEPLDFCSIPRGVMRSFKNISNDTGRMLAILHNETPDQEDRTTHAPALRQNLEALHGPQVFEALEKIGLRFDAKVSEEPT